MITVSGCLIVRDESDKLARCLDSMRGILDEIVIVDTGSTDNTRDIALQYTDKVYDYEWNDNFADARNYAFSKCTMEYIFSIDADEILTRENHAKFLWMKQTMSDDIEIVQMNYVTDLKYNTIYNSTRDVRLKMYRRIRNFKWQSPIHESVITEPVVYKSDIDIIHMPSEHHGRRDFDIYYKALDRGEHLTEMVYIMFARELYVCDIDDEFIRAGKYILSHIDDEDITQDELKACLCVIARYARLKNDIDLLMSASVKSALLGEMAAEVCYELGKYYSDRHNYDEASIWFYNAAYEATSICNIHYSTDYPKRELEKCEEKKTLHK